jgi:hypothetical protein
MIKALWAWFVRRKELMQSAGDGLALGMTVCFVLAWERPPRPWRRVKKLSRAPIRGRDVGYGPTPGVHFGRLTSRDRVPDALPFAS